MSHPARSATWPSAAEYDSVSVFDGVNSYALLPIVRYREELHSHADRHRAMGRALRRAGPATLASAATFTSGPRHKDADDAARGRTDRAARRRSWCARCWCPGQAAAVAVAVRRGPVGSAWEASPRSQELTILVRLLRALREREILAFGVVGLIGYVTDVGIFNLLRYAGDPGVLEAKPLTAKVLSVTAAIVVTYLGNRHWTWRHRPRRGHRREFVLFVGFSVAGMAISLLCLAVSHYALGLTSALADNVSANVIGLVLGTVFRFWAYRTHVFPQQSVHA